MDKKDSFKIYIWIIFTCIGCLLTNQRIQSQVKIINGVAVPADFPTIETNIMGDTAPGRIFISSTFFTSSRRSNYLIICENDGTPYFYRKYSRDYLGCGDFKVQPNGLLSFYKYIYNEDGFFIIMDQNFVEIDTFQCVGHYRTDSHELTMLPNGHALLVCDHDSIINMSQYVTGGRTNARVIGMNVQEVDSDGNLYWEWNSWEHLNILDAIGVNFTAQTIDYMHLNSVAVDYDGHYILSLNRFDEVCKVNNVTGEFIWRLGGVNNEFTFINESNMISKQHHAVPVPGFPDHYTIYDNTGAGVSRGVEYALDINNRTAEKVWEYLDDRCNYMMGSVQRLANGNSYIDWSTTPPLRACEVNEDNDLVFKIEVQGISGYRSFRFDWDGMMQKPYLLAESLPEAVILIFNKFGDQDVKEYQVEGGKTPDEMDLLYTTSQTYAELTDLDNASHYYLRVCAVNHLDQKSDYSDVVEVDVQYSIPGANLIINGDFSSGTTNWNFVTQENGQGSGTVENGEYHVQIINGGIEYWNVQLIQESFPIVQGRDYVFEFDAYSETERIIEPRVAQNGGSYIVYSKTSPIYITTQKQHYRYEFEMTDPSDDQARLVLNCGASDIDCYFDNIVVAEIVENDISVINSEHPDDFIVLQNYPNPFNSSTVFKYYLPERSGVKVFLYDITGRCAAELLDNIMEAGWHDLKFKGTRLSSGIYFCKIKTQSLTKNRFTEQTRKWILLK